MANSHPASGICKRLGHAEQGDRVMPQPSLGFCGHCQERVPADYHIKEGHVWFRKTCPDCGTTESLVSSDAASWQAKRVLWEGDPQSAPVACTLHCDKCRNNHGSTTLFLDVTNRCNMDCPMCGFSLRGMGFEFNPPLEYFEKVFQAVAEMRPQPVVSLFGGEPPPSRRRRGRRVGLRSHGQAGGGASVRLLQPVL